jgi:hypothetical protein
VFLLCVVYRAIIRYRYLRLGARGERGERRDGRGDRSEAEREGEGRGERVGRGVVGWWMGDGGEEGKRCSGTHDHGERTDLSLTQLVAGDTIHDRGHVQIHARLRYLAALRYGLFCVLPFCVLRSVVAEDARARMDDASTVVDKLSWIECSM